MTAKNLLSHLEDVRSRGKGRWFAKCPGHSDENPSLSVCEGDNGRVLLHDFGGCSPREIVTALGLRMADLFTGAPSPHGQRPGPRSAKVDPVAVAFQFDLTALDSRLRAKRILQTAKALPVPRLSNEELDRALASVGVAYDDLERAELLEGVADALRLRVFKEAR